MQIEIKMKEVSHRKIAFENPFFVSGQEQ